MDTPCRVLHVQSPVFIDYSKYKIHLCAILVGHYVITPAPDGCVIQHLYTGKSFGIKIPKFIYMYKLSNETFAVIANDGYPYEEVTVYNVYDLTILHKYSYRGQRLSSKNGLTITDGGLVRYFTNSTMQVIWLHLDSRAGALAQLVQRGTKFTVVPYDGSSRWSFHHIGKSTNIFISKYFVAITVGNLTTVYYRKVKYEHKSTFYVVNDSCIGIFNNETKKNEVVYMRNGPCFHDTYYIHCISCDEYVVIRDDTVERYYDPWTFELMAFRIKSGDDSQLHPVTIRRPDDIHKIAEFIFFVTVIPLPVTKIIAEYL